MNLESNAGVGLRMSRRAVIWRVGGTAAGAAGLSLLAACTPAAPAAAPTSAPAAAAKPAATTAPAAPAAAAASPAAAAAAASPVAAAAKPAAAPTGTLRYASADFSGETFDNIIPGSQWSNVFYDSLLTYTPTGDITGNVAETYTLSPDGLTWTFNIRKDIKFWDGSQLTSADVLFSLQRFGSKESVNPWSPYILRNSDTITATDPYTIVYKALKPEWPLKVPFAEVRIWSKAYFDRVGLEGFRKEPMGSGPYKFVKWTPKTSIEMEANTNYWGAKPAFAKVLETLVPEESTRLAQLDRGEVDIIGNLSFDRLIELRNKGFRLQEIGLPTAANLSFPGTWMTSGPTKDKRVREAMSMAINRQELSDTFYKGLAKPGGWWFFGEKTWGFDSSLFKPDPYDPAKARQLLQEAGYPRSFTPATVQMYTQAVNADLMQVIQGYWQAVGIEANINVVDTPVYNGLVFARATQPTDRQVGIVWPWVGATAPINYYHSANMFTSTGVHTTSNDPKADQLYTSSAAESDEAKAKKIWQELFQYAYSDMKINTGLVNYPTYFVVGPNVGTVGRTHRNIWEAYATVQHKA